MKPDRLGMYQVRIQDIDGNRQDFWIVASSAALAFSNAVVLATEKGVEHPEVTDVRLTHRVDAIV